MKNRTLFGRILAAAVILMAVSLWFPAGSKEARADGIKPTIGTHKATFSGIDPIKLYDDMVFDWNVFFEDDVDLNGHTLTVHGNVIQVEDTVHINGGRLIIDGDYYIGNYFTDDKSCFSDFYWCYANLIMDNPDDYVLVGGTFSTYSQDDENVFTAGTLEVRGDFHSYYSDSFNATGTKVILSGKDKQTIHFSSDSSGFHDLILKNTNIEADSPLRGWKLTQDITFGNGLPNGVYDCMDLNGHTMTVIGDMKLLDIRGDSSAFRLNGGTLDICTTKEQSSRGYFGTFIQEGGTMDISGGRLLVDGDYYIARLNVGPFPCGANLVMDTDDDYVLVGRSFVTCSEANQNSNKSDDNIYTAGTLEVKGDFLQKRLGSFTARGTKVVMSGERVSYGETGFTQNISFETAAFGDGFYDLVLENPDVYVITPLRGWSLSHDITFSNGLPWGLCGDMDLRTYTMDVRGDLTLMESALIKVNQGRLQVSGALIQKEGTISMGVGTLAVGGDYVMAQWFPPDKNGYTRPTSPDDYYWAKGNLIMESDRCVVDVDGSVYAFCENNSTTSDQKKHMVLTGGTMFIGGNFYQGSGTASSFPASNNHVVVLDGTGNDQNGHKQYIYMPRYDDSKFATVKLMRDISNYVFQPEKCWNNIVIKDDESDRRVTIYPNGGEAEKSIIWVPKDGYFYDRIPKIERRGYRFTGWYTEAAGGYEITGDPKADKDTAVYAHWQKIQCFVPRISKLNAEGSCITLEWNPAFGAGGYQIRYGTDPTMTEAEVKEIAAPEMHTATLYGLTPGKKYYIELYAWELDSALRKVFSDPEKASVVVAP